MASEAKLRLTAEGFRRAGRRVVKLGRDLDQMGARGARATQMVQRGLGRMTAKLRGVGGLVAGAGIAAGMKKVLDYRDALGQLEADTGFTTARMEKMDRTVRKTATTYKAQKEQVIGAIQVYQDFGGIVDKGMTTLGKLIEMHKATGASAAELATIHSTMIQTLNMTPEEGIEAMNAFVAQTLAGQVSLRKLAGVIPNVMAGATGYGFKGMRGVHQIGTALQVAGQATGGGAEEARTQVKALLRDLVRRKDLIQKDVKKGGLGVKLFDVQGNLRDLDKIMAEILKATHGKMAGTKKRKGLSDIFTQYSMTLASAYGSQFDFMSNQFWKGSTVERVMAGSKAAKGEDVREMYVRRTQGIGKEAQELKGAIIKLDSTLMELGGQITQWIGRSPAKAVATGVGAYALYKTLPHMIGGIVGAFAGRRKGAGGAGGLGGLGGGGVQPVYVVNMPGATFGQAAGYGMGPGGAAAAAKKGPWGGGAANVAGATVGAATLGAFIGTAADAFDREHGKWLMGREGKLLGGSDAMAEMWFQGMKTAGLLGGGPGFGTTEAQQKHAAELAAQLVEMRGRGVKLGGKKTITEEVILQQLKQVTGVEMTQQQLVALLRKVAENTAALKQQQIVKFEAEAGGFFGMGRGSRQGAP
jgi:hypothetical protein